MANISNIIGERIKTYRNRAGYSQEELAERAGVHGTYIGQLERGEKNATLESIEKVARALNVSLEVLTEKIVVGDTANELPNKFYNLVSPLNVKEQEHLYKIVKKIVEYKNI